MANKTKLLGGLIFLASGDPISIVHEAGDGTAFSYTTAINIAITNYGGQGWGTLNLGTWVSATSGVHDWVGESYVQRGSQPSTMILIVGQNIQQDTANINTHGLSISGMEI